MSLEVFTNFPRLNAALTVHVKLVVTGGQCKMEYAYFGKEISLFVSQVYSYQFVTNRGDIIFAVESGRCYKHSR